MGGANADLEVVLEPGRPLEHAHTLLAGVIVHLPVQGAEGQQAGEGDLALRADGLFLVHRPVQQAAGCRGSTDGFGCCDCWYKG